MKTSVKDILLTLEELAPLGYQEAYDNAGLIAGSKEQKVNNVLLSLDCTEKVIDEAIAKKCNVVLSHHPILFKGIKSLTGANYVERTLIKAIKNDIAIIAWHTNLDNVLHNGVNQKIAQKLGLKDIQILNAKSETLLKLVTYVPKELVEKVANALYAVGCGQIGNYSNCSFKIEGTGSFKPSEAANPVIGNEGELSSTKEIRLEVLMPKNKEREAVAALRKAHSYEEVAFEVYPILNKNQDIGSGAIGILPAPMTQVEFLDTLKKQFNLSQIRFTKPNKQSIKTVAVCGGSGSFLIGAAKAKQADVFVSSDIKYHEFFDGEEELMICDIGHYESEISTLEIFSDVLSKKFTNFATLFTEIDTNPVKYYI